MIKRISIENRWIVLLFIIYAVGTIGMSIPKLREYFLPLTPLNLLLTLVVFYKVNKDFSGKFLVLSLLIFIIGYGVEAIGVATGMLFGDYWYGEPFGVKVFETPIMIGVNWLFLSFASVGLAQSITKNNVLHVILPPLIMVGLDFLVEPVAIKLGFWYWKNEVIPVQNYVMWFITSLVISMLIYGFKFQINKKVSLSIIAVQVVFFGILNLVL